MLSQSLAFKEDLEDDTDLGSTGVGKTVRQGQAWSFGDWEQAVLKCWQPTQAGQLVVLLAQDAVMQLRQKTQDKWESG